LETLREPDLVDCIRWSEQVYDAMEGHPEIARSVAGFVGDGRGNTSTTTVVREADEDGNPYRQAAASHGTAVQLSFNGVPRSFNQVLSLAAQERGGNALAQGQSAEAEYWFRFAVDTDAENNAAINNLAIALSLLGREGEADASGSKRRRAAMRMRQPILPSVVNASATSTTLNGGGAEPRRGATRRRASGWDCGATIAATTPKRRNAGGMQ
jgi:hypothetical protein